MYTIYVYKYKRRLVLTSGNHTMFSCEIGLGPAPTGPKMAEGDGKTPQGRYAVCTRNAQSKYTLFLGLNYPSPEDASHTFEKGMITLAQFEAIRRAHLNCLRPPWDTPLGGQIGIHGGGVEINGILTDNTAGCIALRDEDIKTLWTYAAIGTPVIILP
jgi:murein L,D-transpeptidase YafK